MSNVVAEDTVAVKVQMKSDGTFVVKNLQDKIKKSTDNIKGYFGGVNQTAKSTIKTLATFAASAVLVTSLSGSVRGLVKDTIGFNTEFTQVRTLLDESKTHIIDYENKIVSMGGALGDVTSITKGTYQMISSGQDAESALQKIGDAARFAQGGQVALRDAVSVGTVYLNAYGEAAGGLSHIYDVLWQTIKDGVTTAPELAHAMGRVVPVAREAGLSIEEVSGSIAVMTQISQNTNESVTALRGIISEVIKPSEEAAKEAERLGINFSIAGIKAMGFSAWLEDVVQKVQANDGDMAKLWGRVDALNGVFQLTRNSLENFKNEMVKMSQVTGNNEESFRKYKESFQGAWETMQNKLQAIFIKNILPVLKDAANWISQNTEKIESFVQSAIAGFKSIVSTIIQFKDVLITVGKIWVANFAISKIAPFFTGMNKGFANLKEYYKVLRLEGNSAMASLTGAMKTATGSAAGLGAKLRAIPESIKISVYLVGAELVGRALATFFKQISDYYDRGMAKIIEETEKTTGVTGKLNQEISRFVRQGESHKKVVEEIKKKLEFFGYTTENSTQYIKRLHELLGQSNEWRQWQDNLKSAGGGVKNLTISLVENQQVYKELADTVGKYTRVELDSLVQQGIITETQREKLLKLQSQYLENKKVIDEQRKAVDELAASMGVLTSRGYQEQSKNIKDLISLYSQYKTQIATNSDTLKTWVDKIDELWKTALPREKEALGKIREEMILNYGEQNKVIVSTGTYNDKIIESLFSLTPWTQAIYMSRGALYSQGLMMSAIATGNMPLLMQAWEMMGLKMSETGKETENVDKKTNDLSNTFSALSQTINSAFDALSGFGIKLGGIESIFKGVSGGLNAIGSGLNAIKKAESNFTGFLQKASGYINVFSGAVSAGVSILKGFIDLLSGKSGELEAAERRLSGLSGTTEDWGAKVEELAKQLGGANSAGRAFNMLLADIISSSNVTVSNFDSYIQKVREVVSTYEQGFATLEETQSNYGAAFDAILKKAVDLGLEGGHQMTGLILLAEEFGLKVGEIEDYLESNKKTAIEGYRSFLEAAFSGVRIGVLDEWLAFEEKVANNQTLVNGVQGVTDSLIGLSNTTRLTQEQYNNFQLAASDAYSSLISQGFTTNEALQVMQPLLERLAFLQHQYGYTVDESTQALINQGIEAGLISEDMKTENQLMIEGFDRIVDRLDLIAAGLGVKIPDALGSLDSASGLAFSSIQNHTGTWSNQLETINGQFGDLQDSAYRLNSTYDDIMVGHSIIPLTDLWLGKLVEVDSQMYEMSGTVSILDQEYTIFTRKVSDATREEWQTALDEIQSRLANALPGELEILKGQYDFIMRQMSNSTETYFLGPDGVLTRMIDMMNRIADQSYWDISSQYGVYSDEQKQEMTLEFYQLRAMWRDHHFEVMASERGLENLYSQLKSLRVVDEAKGDYDKFFAGIKAWYAHIERGEVWDPVKQGWIKPASAARGARFVVPPGFEREKGFPLNVHSGELVQVFTREETQRIIRDDMRFFPKVGSDLPASLGTPTQTLHDFYTYPDYSDFESDTDDDIELNDGIAPVFVPGKTGSGDTKIEINVNLKIESIEINIEQKGDSEIDKEEMRQQFSEMLKDDFRAIGGELAEVIQRKLKEKI